MVKRMMKGNVGTFIHRCWDYTTKQVENSIHCEWWGVAWRHSWHWHYWKCMQRDIMKIPATVLLDPTVLNQSAMDLMEGDCSDLMRALLLTERDMIRTTWLKLQPHHTMYWRKRAQKVFNVPQRQRDCSWTKVREDGNQQAVSSNKSLRDLSATLVHIQTSRLWSRLTVVLHASASYETSKWVDFEWQQ